MRNHQDEIVHRIKASARFIRSKTTLRPRIALILGSGFSSFASILSRKNVIETSSIPYYPELTVEGHLGKLIVGKLDNVPLLVFQGRVHFYESGDVQTVLYPLQVAAALGIRTLIITNAAGGVNDSFQAGNLMLISDQMNLTFENPLVNYQTSSRTVLRDHVYDAKLQEIAKGVAKENGIPLRTGVYCGVKGPSYETAAEIEMIRRLGGDAVGMSTVNEVSFANELGMRVIGISCITNLATGIGSEKLSHKDVTEAAESVRQDFQKLVQNIIAKLQ
jgi:purine-nucleoside phosphorylase